MKTRFIKEINAQRINTRYIPGVVMLFMIFGVIICANMASAAFLEDRYSGTYTASRSTENGKQALTLDLKKNGDAVLKVVSSKFSIFPKAYSGSWNVNNSGRIEVDLKSGSNRENFIFIQENNRLRPVSWDKEEWGDRMPNFEKKYSDDYQNKYPLKYIGIYYANIKKSGFDQTLTLTIKKDGYASIRTQSNNKYHDENDREDNGYRNADRSRSIDTYTANWFEVENNVIRIEPLKNKLYGSFTLRKVGDRLETVNWDRDEWGYSPVKFSKDNNYDNDRPKWDDRDNYGKSGTSNLGSFVAFNENGSKRKRLYLDLQPDNRAVLIVNEGSSERTYRGTWDNKSFGAIRIDVRRSDKEVRLDLRPYRRGYQTTYWSKEDWGYDPIVFTKRK